MDYEALIGSNPMAHEEFRLDGAFARVTRATLRRDKLLLAFSNVGEELAEAEAAVEKELFPEGRP
jgi:hypothetical protein